MDVLITHFYLKVWFDFLADYAEKNGIYLDIDDYQNTPKNLIDKLERLFVKSITTIFAEVEDGKSDVINQASLDAISVLLEFANPARDEDFVKFKRDNLKN